MALDPLPQTSSNGIQILDKLPEAGLSSGSGNSEVVCCGGKPASPADQNEQPGYQINHFVERFLKTAIGAVPQVRTKLQWQDRLGQLRARIGISRDFYRVAPGLYAVGEPDEKSEVLVTASYKLSFDSLRRELSGINAWILVIDTHGINVWCAAGKGTFGTQELISRVRRTRLDQLVSHRRLILPQLGATGVTAKTVRKETGFRVVWGPVQASAIHRFLENGRKADPKMRTVTFTLLERLVLIPVEFYSIKIKWVLWTALTALVLSGIGPQIFSISAAWQRGWLFMLALLVGAVAGNGLVPALLPWLPGRAFAVKGALAGLAVGALWLLFISVTAVEAVALLLLVTSFSSFAGMNFTGSTPFTSPTGVEKEMRQFMPFQILGLLIAMIAWLTAPFL